MEYRSLEHKIRDLWIAENNRNTEIRRKVENVGRPKDNVKDETSKLGKQGEIKTKIVDEEVIDEAADGDVGNVVADKKKPKPKDKDDSDKSSDKAAKKDTDMDDMEAKTVKGGKTEVDTEPKTDDSTEDSSDESKKSKKATNQENKKIGAKGVKEETMTDKLTFGSPQSLIDSIAEAMKSMKGICPKCKKAKCMCEGWKEETELEEKLVGGQKKLDKNHNGKIDKQDFKILKGKKVEEEFEELDERDAGNKVKKDAAVSAVGAANKDEKHLTTKGTGIRGSVADKIRGREVTSGKDRMKEEVEQIDELDRDGVVKRYADKARKKVEGGEESPEKRAAGRLMAGKKRWGGKGGIPAAKVPAVQREETDPGFSEAELARIEEIANNIDEVVTARKLTAADKAARAKYLEGHAAKMAGMAHHAIKGDAKSFKARNTEHGDYSKEPSKMAGIGLDHTLTKQDTKVSK